ncbi:MAG: LL-diaminopimelate aminotransferase [Firmicutes bacterium]|nr:LL-diaminopimelate aminotransferase [Bacillota bacterium]
MKLNNQHQKLKENYLFSNIAKKVNEFNKYNSHVKLIKLGIGDVTRPLVPSVIKAMQEAVLHMGDASTFKGYGLEQGYLFLREAIKNYYLIKGAKICEDEIFISDGAKSDIGNILDLFDKNNIVLIPDPVYPAYLDTNIMAGQNVIFLKAAESNEFLPMPDKNIKADIIYLCSPNNPTGAVYTKDQLKIWVDYAIKNAAVILFDSAYEAFIDDKNLPTSIMQIEGAKKCAIEFCSFSKTAGFTGVRCGYTVVPKELKREGQSLNKMWLRRQSTKFNGVSYIVQKGAEAVFSQKGQKQIKENIDYYKQNAKIICDCLNQLDIYHCGGINAPYVWLKCGMDSWEFFDFLLNNAAIIGTPGAGFGEMGEGYFRLSAFSTRDSTIEAMNRLLKILK